MYPCSYCGHADTDWRHKQHVNPDSLTSSQHKALAILDDCERRKGLKDEFWQVDDMVIMDILQSWCDIIDGEDKELQHAG